MTDDRDLDDALVAALAELDPAAADQPPAPGSSRHRSILEHAMQPHPDAVLACDPADAQASPDVARTWPRRFLVALVAAAAAVVVIGALVVLPGPEPAPASAAEALAHAARSTGEVVTLRIAATYERPGSTNRLTAEADGADYSMSSVSTAADGSRERETTVVIGDTVWEEGSKRIAPPEERNAPYAPSSAAVVKAVLDGSTLRDLGDENVRGVTARHIRATLTPNSRAALAALTPSQVAMFELEHPDGVHALDIWVADDLIRRIRVVVDEGPGEDGAPQTNTATIEFYDFGADITVAPPS